jgi:lipopolysaccharide transport system ATP-binding protein
MSSNDIAIRAQGLSKCYGIYANPRDLLKQFILPRIQRLIGQAPKQYFSEFWAVKDVSFELRRGECLGLIGHNGAGKTTLLKMLNGLIKPDAGSITMRGRVGALIALRVWFNPILTGRSRRWTLVPRLRLSINGSVLGFTKKH